MNSSHLLDPGLADLLANFPAAPLSNSDLPRIRGFKIPFPPDDIPATSERLEIPGTEGTASLTLFVHRPRSARSPLPCIFHIHGGGFVAGSAESSAFTNRQWSAGLDCVVVSVDYRLAPETQFPGPLEDCYTALAWVFDNAEAQGIDRRRIGVMGESAGGGLAAGLALLARDRGDYALAFQHLMYPMLDDRTCVEQDPNPFAGEFIWTAESNGYGWRSFLGCEPGSDGVSAYAAPARATDLAGLPPTCIVTAALDLFIDENLEYARRLIRVGVPTELHVFPGATHAFDIMPDLAIAKEARAARADSLKRAMSAQCTAGLDDQVTSA